MVISIFSPQNVPYSGWAMGVTCCPNCRHQLQVSMAPSACRCVMTPQSPLTPTYTIQPSFLPHTAICTASSSSIKAVTCTEDIFRLKSTLKALNMSGWYYGNINWQEARNLLMDSSIGTFLLRNSRDSKFIFSLSIQTDRGPTSVRLHYQHGLFWLDCASSLKIYMPRFPSAMELLQYYTRQQERSLTETVWVDSDGCTHSPVILKSPKRKSPPSLRHSARLAIHKALDSNPHTPKLWFSPKHKQLPLPSPLIDYLGEYPYTI